MIRRVMFVLAVLCLAVVAEARRTEAALEPDDLYARVAPAVAFIRTPYGQGSGVLVDSTHLLTNAHVAWPAETVRVRFMDGTEFAQAPVVAWDHLADMALVEVPPVAAEPLALGDASRLRTGARVYALGYPGEMDDAPPPTIVQGLLSRTRRGGPAGLDYVQTDAPAAPGLSGGAIVSAEGALLAIAEFRLPETPYLLGAFAGEALGSVRGLRAAGNDAVGDRRLSSLGTPMPPPYTFEVEGFYGEQALLVPAGRERNVDVEVRGAGARLDAFTMAGAHADNGIPIGSDLLGMRLHTEAGIQYVVTVRSATAQRATFTAVASEPLLRLADPDSGSVLLVGESHVGMLEFAGARQWYRLQLEAGQRVSVTLSSIAIDAFLAVDRPESDSGPLAVDDDSGGGLLGQDAEVVLTAPRTGVYLVSVRDTAGASAGAYVLRVTGAR